MHADGGLFKGYFTYRKRLWIVDRGSCIYHLRSTIRAPMALRLEARSHAEESRGGREALQEATGDES
jgi:hypothetical protein